MSTTDYCGNLIAIYLMDLTHTDMTLLVLVHGHICTKSAVKAGFLTTILPSV